MERREIILKHRKKKTTKFAVFTCDCGCRFISRYISYKLPKCPECTKPKKPNVIYKKKNSRLSNGFSGHPLSYTWNCMKYRCYNKTRSNYHNYGGRGITVCDEWLNSFDVFFSWAIKAGWKQGLYIDRIDNNKGYCPENCRFVSSKISCRNKGKMSNNKSGYSGVFLDKKNKKWRSIIFVDGNNISIGGFNSAYDAAKARDEFIIEYQLEGFNLQVL
jgi:hypothetical protein